jgi:hypothetical protein
MVSPIADASQLVLTSPLLAVTARTVVGNVVITGIPFDVQTSFPGLNGFNHQAVVPATPIVTGSGGGDPFGNTAGSDFIRITLAVVLNNPAPLILFTNFVRFEVLYGPTKALVGYAYINPLNLYPGTSLRSNPRTRSVLTRPSQAKTPSSPSSTTLPPILQTPTPRPSSPPTSPPPERYRLRSRETSCRRLTDRSRKVSPRSLSRRRSLDRASPSSATLSSTSTPSRLFARTPSRSRRGSSTTFRRPSPSSRSLERRPRVARSSPTSTPSSALLWWLSLEDRSPTTRS